MTRRTVLLAVAALIGGMRAISAHDGHGETLVLAGTIRAIAAERIEIEARDEASMQLKRVWVITSPKTKYKRGKQFVDAGAAELTLGERVTAVVRSEHTDDKSLRLLALQLELKAKKK
jgi:hypothetical protein